VVADFVGRFAEWDRSQRTSAKVMAREEILALARHGVLFGSHRVSHTAVDCFTVVNSHARSRAMLEAWLGHPLHYIAPPFGGVGESLVRLARFCGYQIGFTTARGVAKLDDDLLRLPRIEIQGGWQLDQLIGVLEQSR
jgi:peptidoglycan/xylan/chitin deacetylase (PgdA/CDA1 family)